MEKCLKKKGTRRGPEIYPSIVYLAPRESSVDRETRPTPAGTKLIEALVTFVSFRLFFCYL